MSLLISPGQQLEAQQSDGHFDSNLMRAYSAIDAGIYPELVPAGSSGTYFVRDINGEILAVFKPKDEEPFAQLNPKWPKMFQRFLCFCCFGRACLKTNNGYLSETAASIVDSKLGLYIVPKTKVVYIRSPSFNYGGGLTKSIKFGPKVGSYQLFVSGYKSASELVPEWNNKGLLNVFSSPSEQEEFTLLFQKLCVLDYAIRNTDRHLENWLIRHVPGEPMVLAAIDNALARTAEGSIVAHADTTLPARTLPRIDKSVPSGQITQLTSHLFTNARLPGTDLELTPVPASKRKPR